MSDLPRIFFAHEWAPTFKQAVNGLAMSTDLPPHGHALRRGRFSQPGATYFLTLCTADRRQGLTDPTLAAHLLAEAQAMTADTTWQRCAATVMPDHLHLLVTLGDRLPLDKTVNRHKAKTSAALKRQGPGIAWERGFFDHKLRAEESVVGVLHYLYLNPYRAGLIEGSATWPWFYYREEDWPGFQPTLEETDPIEGNRSRP